MTLANRALAPMILPDESNPQADEGISLLVISEYATGAAARAAIALRDRDISKPPAEEQRTLIEEGLILGEQNSNESRWQTLLERAGNRPIWMLNMLEFRATAQYPEDAGEAAPSTPIVGSEAYQRYGRGMIRTLGAVGGRVGWGAGRLHQVGGPDEGAWHQLAIAVYPAPAAMLTMLAMPKYRAAHVHREAALARTRLLATRPLDDREG